MKPLCQLIFITLLFLLTGCNRPKEIPNEKLVKIVSELFLVNSSWDISLVPDSLRRDSVDLYSPVFERYGYDPEDFIYTIERLSLRKSGRITDIIDSATVLLKAQGDLYFAQVALRDTIQLRARELFKEVVYRELKPPQIKKAKNYKDQPDIRLPVRLGSYLVEFSYRIDTIERNGYVQYMHYLTDSLQQRTEYTYRSLSKGGQPTVDQAPIKVAESNRDTLNITLIYHGGLLSPKVSATYDSIRVTYYLPPEVVLDSLRHFIFRHHILDSGEPPWAFAQINESKDPQNFVTLRVDSTGVAPLADSLVRHSGKDR